MLPRGFLRAVLAISSFYTFCSAHTWVEQLNIIAPNGTMVGAPGFPRGNVQRSSPGFNDDTMVNLIPPNGGTVNVIQPGQLMCKQSQTAQTQSADSPRLKAAAGATVALRYQENGHVSLPQNQPGKPSNRGTNFVYYTTNSQPTDKFLDIHRVWTTDGSGGDGRGRLISRQNFDDSQCYQVNSGTISGTRQKTFSHSADSLMGADLWCQQDIQIPKDAPTGSTVTLYWVWDWPTMPGTQGFPQGKQEFYTTCMDIDIVPGTSSTGLSVKAAVQRYLNQDYVSAAASSQFADIGNPTAVAYSAFIPFPSAGAAESSTFTQMSSSPATTPMADNPPSSTSFAAHRQSTNTPMSSQAVGIAKTVTVTITRTSPPTGQSPCSDQRMIRRLPNNSLTDDTVTTTRKHRIITEYETDLVTVMVTNTINDRRASKSIKPAATGYASLHTNGIVTSLLTRSPVVNVAKETVAVSPALSSKLPCSKTEAPYRLRGRSPFYVFPSGGTPSTGC